MCPIKRQGMTREEALLRMADLCARSEQCASEIEKKLRLKKLSNGDIAAVIEELERRNFLDSSRFARSFANDKLKFSGWGRLKIQAALKLRRIPSSDISEAINTLDSEEYNATLMRVSKAKARLLDLSSYAERTKLLRHLVSRGFTPSESTAALKNLVSNEDS